MEEITTYLSEFTLNVNGLNSVIKDTDWQIGLKHQIAYKKMNITGHWRPKLIILATQEAENKRIAVQSHSKPAWTNSL
jgi:hypothetical protein